MLKFDQAKERAKKQYGLILAAAALLILVLGFLFKPRDPNTPKSSGNDILGVRADMENLREMARRNSLRNTAQRFAELAAADSNLLLRDPGNETHAILWDTNGTILAATTLAPASLKLQLGEQNVPAALQTTAASFPFAVYQASGLNHPVANKLKTADLRPGMWLLADVITANGPAFLSGMFAGMDHTTCQGINLPTVTFNTPLDRRFLGAGVFDIDGNLVAAVARCDDGFAAIPVDEIEAHIQQLTNSSAAPTLRLGFDTDLIKSPLDKLLHASAGFVVTDTWDNWPAQRSGLQPGDVITAVNNQPVTTYEQLNKALQQQSLQLTVQRGKGKPQQLVLNTDKPVSLFTVQAAAGGVLLDDVAPTLTNKLGLVSGDRIPVLNGAAATSEGLSQLFAKPVPAWFTVQRGPRHFLAVVNQ